MLLRGLLLGPRLRLLVARSLVLADVLAAGALRALIRRAVVGEVRLRAMRAVVTGSRRARTPRLARLARQQIVTATEAALAVTRLAAGRLATRQTPGRLLLCPTFIHLFY